MIEEQKHWEISVKMSSKDCPYSDLAPPNITDGKINNSAKLDAHIHVIPV